MDDVIVIVRLTEYNRVFLVFFFYYDLNYSNSKKKSTPKREDLIVIRRLLHKTFKKTKLQMLSTTRFQGVDFFFKKALSY
jgi:hypothetical protein